MHLNLATQCAAQAFARQTPPNLGQGFSFTDFLDVVLHMNRYSTGCTNSTGTVKHKLPTRMCPPPPAVHKPHTSFGLAQSVRTWLDNYCGAHHHPTRSLGVPAVECVGGLISRLESTQPTHMHIIICVRVCKSSNVTVMHLRFNQAIRSYTYDVHMYVAFCRVTLLYQMLITKRANMFDWI